MPGFVSMRVPQRDPARLGPGPVLRHLRMLLLCVICLGAARAQTMPLLALPPATTDGRWSVLFEKIGDSHPLVAHRPDALLAPASVLKLFSTAYVLDRLGADARQCTQLRARGLDQGTLQGPLVFVGGGDPNLSSRRFPYTGNTEHEADSLVVLRDLAEQLWQAGVRRVPDGIVAVDGPFPAETGSPPGWTEDDQRFWYGAPIHGLYINDASVLVRVRPAAKPGALATVQITPNPQGFIRNAVRTVGKRQPTEPVRLVADTTGWRLSGSVRAGSRTLVAGLAQPDPPRFAAITLAEVLRERGIAVSGDIQVRGLSRNRDAGLEESGSPEQASVLTHARLLLAEHWSPPLAEEIQVINKVSQNTHIETLTRLADIAQGRSGTRSSAVAGLGTWARERGLLVGQTRFVDASGLSRDDRLSANDLVRLLNWATQQPWWPEYAASLPEAGSDGTLRHRFRTLDAGMLLAKTGTLSDAISLAGILYIKPEQAYVFAILVNDFSLSRAALRGVLDRLVQGWARALALAARDDPKTVRSASGPNG